jgi:hypothetical protein
MSRDEVGSKGDFCDAGAAGFASAQLQQEFSKNHL